MGNEISKLFWLFSSKIDARILMIGLDAAGKTTVLYQLKMGKLTSTTPTIGFNVDTLQYKRMQLTVWDIGGQKRLRTMWRYYYKNVSGIIFVVDSADQDRFSEAAMELHKVMQLPEMEQSVLLVLANKQDLPNAVTARDLAIRMHLHELSQPWTVHGVCASSRAGVFDGLELLYAMLLERHERQRRKFLFW